MVCGGKEKMKTAKLRSMRLSFVLVSFYALLILAFAHSQGRRDNWAVLLCTSRFFFNYRHFVNTLSVYKAIKDAGYRDDRIIFMNSEEEVACDARNPLHGMVMSDLYGSFFHNASERIGIDFHGDDVTVDSFLRLLVDRPHPFTKLSSRLRSNSNSNVMLFMTGHGGDEFFKFQDTEELSAQEFGLAIEEMSAKRMFNELLVVIDTCQAFTMCNYIQVPNVICIGGSQRHENSFAYLPDEVMGVPLTDRFSLQFVQFIKENLGNKDKSLQDLMNSMDPSFLKSRPVISNVSGSRSPRRVLLSDYFPTDNDKIAMTQKTIQHRQYDFSGFI